MEMAPAGHAHRVDGGGPVERLRHRGPPVDDEGFLVGRGDGDPSDVVETGVAVVEPTEADASPRS